MAYKSAQLLMLDVQKDVGLVNGTAVQTYTEPLIYQAIQVIFDMMFRKRFWDHLTDWYERTVDGTTGLVTVDMDTICKGFEDIECIYLNDFSRQLVKPYDMRYKVVNGSAAMYYTPIVYNSASPDLFTKKIIQFWPVTATSVVAMRIRTKPADFVPQDIVPFPSDIIAMGAAWKLLESDGINPTAAQVSQQMYEILYSDYMTSLSEDVIGYGGGSTHAPLSIRPI